MIALYQAAVARAPDDLALALALGRVYFELEMLDEAAEQFEKIEVRVPDLPVIHAYLGAVFERRGQVARSVRGVPPGAPRPVDASSGPTGARRAGPSTPAGRIGVRHVGAGTASGPSAATPVASGVGQWLTAALDLVFPAFCPVCAERLGPARRDPLCGRCWEGLERIAAPGCARCGLPFGEFAGDALRPAERTEAAATCGACRATRPPSRMRGRPPTYGDHAREAIHAFKFRGRRALAAPLGDLLAERRPPRCPWRRGRDRARATPPAARAGARLQPGLAPRPPGGARPGGSRPVPTCSPGAVATAPQTALGADARRTMLAALSELRRPEPWPAVTSCWWTTS